MFKKQISKQIIYLLIIMIVIIFGSYYFFFEDIKTKNQNISTLSQELSSQSNKQDYILSTQKMLDGMKEDIDLINNSIIAKDGDVAFIENLELVAKSNGLTIDIDSLVFEDDSRLTSLGVTNLKLRAKTKGGWAGTYTFLSQIESLPFDIKVNKFGFVANKDEVGLNGKKINSGNRSWQSSFELTVLKYK